jgi:hypothetical protein
MILDNLKSRDIPRNTRPHFGVAFVTTLGKEIHSMPAKIQMLLKTLKNLPSDFSDQRTAMKMEIIDALTKRNEMIDTIYDELDVLKADSIRRTVQKYAEPVIEKKLSEIAVIREAMSRFQPGCGDELSC